MATSSTEQITTQCSVCGATLSASNVGELAKALSSCNHSLQLVLPYALKFDRNVLSQNATTYSHWTKYAKDKKDWTNRVEPKLGPLAGLNLPQSLWTCTRTYGGRNKLMDYANFVGGAKPLIDCLVNFKVIVDDNPKAFKCEYLQEPCKQSETTLTLIKTSF